MTDLNRRLEEMATEFAKMVITTVREEISNEIRRTLLGEVTSAAPKSVTKPRPKTNLAASRAKAKKVKDETVLEAIPGKGTKGISAQDLAKAVGLVPGALAYRLNKLRAAKKIRSTGQTSKMRYFRT